MKRNISKIVVVIFMVLLPAMAMAELVSLSDSKLRQPQENPADTSTKEIKALQIAVKNLQSQQKNVASNIKKLDNVLVDVNTEVGNIKTIADNASTKAGEAVSVAASAKKTAETANASAKSALAEVSTLSKAISWIEKGIFVIFAIMAFAVIARIYYTKRKEEEPLKKTAPV